MKTMQEMAPADFQKLIALVLADLTIRRTLLENREQEVNQEMRSLEKDAELNTIARKKQMPIRRPPGSLLKMPVITRKIRLGPLCISTPPANADGIITKPARMAAPVSQMDTRMASLFRLFFFGIFAYSKPRGIIWRKDYDRRTTATTANIPGVS